MKRIRQGEPIPPTTARRYWRELRSELARIRSELARVRVLRASSRHFDQEEASGLLDVLWWDHKSVQVSIRALRNATVEGYSHISPAAAKREKARRGVA